MIGLDRKNAGRDKCPMSPEQCRAARGWLDWSRGQLAKRAKLGLSTVADFETRRRTPLPESLGAMRRALEAAGIEFIDGEPPGLRARKRR
jgi:ribosome-binding protein aMBF1 (putative translation factor)